MNGKSLSLIAVSIIALASTLPMQAKKHKKLPAIVDPVDRVRVNLLTNNVIEYPVTQLDIPEEQISLPSNDMYDFSTISGEDYPEMQADVANLVQVPVATTFVAYSKNLLELCKEVCKEHPYLALSGAVIIPALAAGAYYNYKYFGDSQKQAE